MITFAQWKTQRVLLAFADLQGDQRRGAEVFLARVGGLRHISHTPRHWLTRVVAGPRGEELRPSASPTFPRKPPSRL